MTGRILYLGRAVLSGVRNSLLIPVVIDKMNLSLGCFILILLFEEETVFYSCHVSGCRLYPIPWVGNAFSSKLMSCVWVPDLTLLQLLVPLTFIASRAPHLSNE